MLDKLLTMDAMKRGYEEGFRKGFKKSTGIDIEEGIGIYPPRDVILKMAKEAEELEKLMPFLIENETLEDVHRACTDESFRNAKMKEYGL